MTEATSSPKKHDTGQSHAPLSSGNGPSNSFNCNNKSTKKPFSKDWHDIHSKQKQLPVWEHKKNFIRFLEEQQTILVVGETGSGKTTQIPQWCLDYCVRKTKQSAVACTQPRRIAAMSIAERVAAERRTLLGQEIGYSVRFENLTSDRTRLKYLTDGMLLREAMLDETLSAYGIIILDEAHERTLQTEILFGVVKRAYEARKSSSDNENKSLVPLKVIIMSATINVKLFKRYFDSRVLHIKGRQHPVLDLFSEKPQSDLLTSTLTCVFQIHRTCDEGDILVFCSGQDEIQSLVLMTKKILKQAPDSLKTLEPLALYASLPVGLQMKVFFSQTNSKKTIQSNGSTNGIHKNDNDDDDDGRSSSGEGDISDHSQRKDQITTPGQPSAFTRRVIYATNVAETSITIPNIKYVIDTGKVKCRSFCPKTGLESLKVSNVSKAQAKQRAGRAGRVAPGTCYHLYTMEHYTNFIEHLPPEIKRCNLDSVVLQMISIGIKNVSTFEFLDRPDDERLKAALVNLLNLKAIKPSVNLEQTTSEQQTATSYNNQQAKGLANSKDSPQKKKILLTTTSPSGDNNSILNLSYDLTAIGKKLCLFPLDPSMGRILLAANELGCLDEALTVVSLLSIDNLFHIPPNKQSQAEKTLQRFHSNEGDIIMLLNTYRAFSRTRKLNKSGAKFWCQEHFIHMKNLKLAILIRKQLLALCKGAKMIPSSCGQDTTILRKALTYGLFNNVATMFDGKYHNKSAIEVFIHPSSCLFKSRPDCILYVEVVETNKCYMRACTLVDDNWIREVSFANLKRKS